MQLTQASQARLPDGPGWRARLDLRFRHDGQRSYLAFREHLGPLRVQRPFYPEGAAETCHVYLLHPPGGVVGGDILSIQVDVDTGARALITTPAAGKFYRSATEQAVQSHVFDIADAGVLEWLPQDNIIFSGAKVRMTTRVNLADDAQFVGWDITCLGRVSAGQPFDKGQFRSALEIWRQGRPLFVERACIDGGSEVLHARWGLAGYSVVGTLICVGEYPDLVGRINDDVRKESRLLSEDGLFTVTQLSGGLVCRYLGHHGEDAKTYFTAALRHIRPIALGREFHRPRIWDT